MKQCYGYDKELNICLLYGCDCKATDDYECYHTSRQDAENKGLVPEKGA